MRPTATLVAALRLRAPRHKTLSSLRMAAAVLAAPTVRAVQAMQAICATPKVAHAEAATAALEPPQRVFVLRVQHLFATAEAASLPTVISERLQPHLAPRLQHPSFRMMVRAACVPRTQTAPVQPTQAESATPPPVRAELRASTTSLANRLNTAARVLAHPRRPTARCAQAHRNAPTPATQASAQRLVPTTQLAATAAIARRASAQHSKPTAKLAPAETNAFSACATTALALFR